MKTVDMKEYEWGHSELCDWFIHSVDPRDKPKWTEAHIEELLADFHIYRKSQLLTEVENIIREIKNDSNPYALKLAKELKAKECPDIVMAEEVIQCLQDDCRYINELAQRLEKAINTRRKRKPTSAPKKGRGK